MKKIFSIIFAVSIFVNFLSAAEAEKYGAELTLDEPTPISEIIAAPETYEGKKVQVEGMITGVCEKMGCWIEISDSEDNIIKVKVNDGEIVFPMETMGKSAVVEGEVYALETEAASDCSEAHEMKKAESENEEDCCSKKKVVKVYQIKGFGAEIGN